MTIWAEVTPSSEKKRTPVCRRRSPQPQEYSKRRSPMAMGGGNGGDESAAPSCCAPAAAVACVPLVLVLTICFLRRADDDANARTLLFLGRCQPGYTRRSGVHHHSDPSTRAPPRPRSQVSNACTKFGMIFQVSMDKDTAILGFAHQLTTLAYPIA